jgi:phage terminase large subunit-like protein
MSRRKELSQTRMNRTEAEARIRAKQEARVFEYGIPLCPDQYIANNRKLYEIWKQCLERLHRERLLAYSDGPALLEFCRAELNGQQDAKKAIFACTWANRGRFPAPAGPAGTTLAEFIQRVKEERLSFELRVRPEGTVCADTNQQAYSWPEGDASTQARAYAADVASGKLPAGEYLVRAARRFLDDLEKGHERGIYWDPVAARNVVAFATEYCALALMPWQTWVLSSLFAFKRATGYRRFQEAWVSMGRKNGKTKFASTIALFLLICDQEKYAEVYAAATARDQSRIVWRDARRSCGDNPELASLVKRWAGELTVTDTDSRFLPLASEDRSFLGVRAHGIVADEVGVWTDRNAWDVLMQSTVSRPQPLIVAITTAPAHKMTFCYAKFSWVQKILRGIVQADHVFAAIYTIDPEDSPEDIVALRKANPSLGVTLLEEHLVKQIAELDEMPSGLNNFLQFHANVTPENTLTRQGSVPTAKWDACAGLELIGRDNPLDACVRFLELNTDTPMFPGVDVGLTSDLTAVAMLFPRARFTEGGPLVEKKVVIAQIFAPEAGLLEKERAWGVPLSAWARAGWLQLLPGDITDVREIRKYLVNLHSRYRVREVGFDSWQFSVPAAELNEAGIACVAVPQTAKDLTPAVREFLAAVHNGDIVHFGNPILSWMAANVALVESEKHSGIKPEKLEPNLKIDGIAALLNSWHRMLAAPPPSVYNDRGIVLI